MNICSNRHIGLAVLLLAGSLAMIYAEEPVRPRSAAINFSAPKSDTVSTNLNELRTPVSPFQNLESNLKSPFEALDKQRPGPDFRENRRVLNENQAVNKLKLKESLNQRAEQMFLNPEQFEGEKGDEVFFQLSKDSLDPYKKKPKNSLERYNNDRQDRDRMALTNQAGSKNPFSGKNLGHPDDLKFDPDYVKPFKTSGNAGEDRNRSLSLFPIATTNNSSLSADLNASARPEMFNRTENSSIRRQAEADARMEDFKRLLEGSRYTPPTTTAQNSFATPAANYDSTATGNNNASRAAAPPVATSEWSSFKPVRDDSKKDFATSARLVGKLEKPQSLAEFPSATKSLSAEPPPAPAPVQVKKVQPTTFKIPQRRF